MVRKLKIEPITYKVLVDMNGVDSKVYRGFSNPQVLALVPSTAKKVLDVGCGAGDNAMHLQQRGVLVDGVTLSESEARIAEKYCRNVFVHDLEEGLPNLSGEVYDCVICSHVIEHIRFPSKLLYDIRAILSPEGRLVVALPNLMYFKNRYNLLLGRFDYQEGGLMDNTHFRWYTFKTAQNLLEEHGYVKVLAYVDGNFPVPFLRKTMPKNTFAWLDRLASHTVPGLFGFQMLF